jgi:protein TonB
LSLKGVFNSDDYPEDAMAANQSGATKYLLMIDEKGGLIDCVIEETSGVASIDQMGCQVMRERVKAKPALDAAGKPVKSIYRQQVHWHISDQ